ncbi:alcohol dehydrogenase 1-like [Cornus florida]|uniref:alcohol dehydrogenase 1-like n=1 Tax=Cornus florida TaxID=4283 RepID=UPI00289878F3|nr:alcohol dehydrogenase 1-like [Cornus florida]
MSTSSSRVIKCKAAVCRAKGEPVRLEEVEIEPPKASEVRIKMLYASLCHSDILCANGLPFPVFPRALGHEGVGVVESVGAGVTEFKEGDLVIPTFLGECKQCENCKSGQTNVCTTYPMPMHGLMPDNTTRMSLGGQRLYHLFSCSTWSEYTVANVNYVVKIDHPNMPLAHASFISCGFTTGLGAPWKECKAGEDSSVVVFGLGTVGLGAIQGASMQGASRIIGIDKNEVKAAKGQVFGMTDFINPDKYDKSIAELIREGTGGSGADYCFECTGAPPLVAEALEAVKPGIGTLVQVGVGPKPAMEVLFSTLLQGRTVKGYAFGGIKTKSELPIVVDKCANKEINLDELLTHEISLDEIDQAFDLLKKPDCVKVLIKI